MKKCLLICLLALSLLCGCADGNVTDGDRLTELKSAIDTINGESLVSGGYLIEITVSGVTVYYAKGNISFDRAECKAFNDFSQTYMGQSLAAKNYFAEGKLISVEKSGVTTFDRTSEQILGRFPYSKLIELPDDVASVTEKSSSVGKTVELVRKDTKAICGNVIGDDIYSLVSVIKKPQVDKTRYGDTKCIYTLNDGKIVSCRYEFTVTLFDTPAYVPGYSVPESDYTVDLDIVAKVNYTGFGDKVTVAEYVEGETSEN